MSTTRGTVYTRKGSPYWWVGFKVNGKRFAKVALAEDGETKILVGRRNGGKREAQEFLDSLRGDSKRGISPNADRVSLADLERLVLGNLKANARVSERPATAAY